MRQSYRRHIRNGGSSHPFILVLDEDPVEVESICRGLLLAGHDYTGVTSVEEALQILRNEAERPPALLILGECALERSPEHALLPILGRIPGLPVLRIEGLRTPPPDDAWRDVAFRRLQKPLSPERLAEQIGRALAGSGGETTN